MKHTINYILGYIGYFLLAFVSLRFLTVQEDKVGFAISMIGIILFTNYLIYLEKHHGAPKYGGYMKLALTIIFFITSFILLKDPILF